MYTYQSDNESKFDTNRSKYKLDKELRPYGTTAMISCKEN